MKVMKNEVIKLAKHRTILIVDDSPVSLQMYTLMLEDIFQKVYNATNGQEAFDLWMEHNKEIDIILTDIMMPVMDGFELIEKVRQESFGQKIIVLTSLDAVNNMKKIINLCLDGIVEKPYQEENVFPILHRVLSLIKAKQLLETQALQLKLLTKENLALQECAESDESSTAEKVGVKYNIRHHIEQDAHEAKIILDSIDYFDIDAVEELKEHIIEHERDIVEAEKSGLKNELIDSVFESFNIFYKLGSVMEQMQTFEVACESAAHLSVYLKNLDKNAFEEEGKRKLFVENYLLMLEDILQWIEIIFFSKESQNMNYFDASFANGCLCLEAIFNEDIIEESNDDLEFF